MAFYECVWFHDCAYSRCKITQASLGSTKVKNLVNALAFIGPPIDDEDLVAITLNGFVKNYSQFRTSIVIRETFPDFQDLITLLISEEMRIVGTSSNGGS